MLLSALSLIWVSRISCGIFLAQNIPWQLAQHNNSSLFEFIEQKCGTGEMISNLKAGHLDVIVALTEGMFLGTATSSHLNARSDRFFPL